MVKKLKYFFLLVALASATMGFIALRGKGAPGTIRTIVIDAGHGGRDPGCHGVTNKEKDISLAVALKLGKYLEDYYKDAIKVVYTRTTDVFVELEDRAQVANKAKADLFISIHCNAAGKPVMVKDPKTGKKRAKMYKNKKGKLVPVETINPVPFGTETYVMGLKNEAGKMRVATRENSAIFLEDDYEKKYGGFDPESEESYIIMSNYTSAYVIQSANLAVKMQEEYGRKAGRVDKGVHRQSLWVLWRTSMPSILTEIGYLTNPLEEEFLSSLQGQDYLAKAMFRSLRRYKDEAEGNKKTYNDEFENQVPLENENIKAGNSPTAKRTEEDDEDDKVTEIAIETKTLATVTDNTPKKTPVNDGAGTLNMVGNIDSSKKTAAGSDSVLSAKSIAERYKTDKKGSGGQQKPPTGPNAPKPVETGTVALKAVEKTTEISFKVQVASSDAPLDLKGERYAVLSEPAYYEAGGMLKYTSGNFAKFKAAVNHQNSLREKGFPDCFVVAFKNGQRIDLNEAKKAALP